MTSLTVTVALLSGCTFDTEVGWDDLQPCTEFEQNAFDIVIQHNRNNTARATGILGEFWNGESIDLAAAIDEVEAAEFVCGTSYYKDDELNDELEPPHAQANWYIGTLYINPETSVFTQFVDAYFEHPVPLYDELTEEDKITRLLEATDPWEELEDMRSEARSYYTGPAEISGLFAHEGVHFLYGRDAQHNFAIDEIPVEVHKTDKGYAAEGSYLRAGCQASIDEINYLDKLYLNLFSQTTT